MDNIYTAFSDALEYGDLTYISNNFETLGNIPGEFYSLIGLSRLPKMTDGLFYLVGLYSDDSRMELITKLLQSKIHEDLVIKLLMEYQALFNVSVITEIIFDGLIDLNKAKLFFEYLPNSLYSAILIALAKKYLDNIITLDILEMATVYCQGYDLWYDLGLYLTVSDTKLLERLETVLNLFHQNSISYRLSIPKAYTIISRIIETHNNNYGL